MSAKTARPKPRKMWANYYPDGDIVLHSLKPLAAPSAGPNASYRATTVAVIPIGDETTLLAHAANAYTVEFYYGCRTRTEAMRAALTAIGVLPRSRKGRK